MKYLLWMFGSCLGVTASSDLQLSVLMSERWVEVQKRWRKRQDSAMFTPVLVQNYANNLGTPENMVK